MSQSKNKKYTKHRRRKPFWPTLLLAVGGLLLVLGVFFAFNQSVGPRVTIEVSGTPSLKVDHEQIDLGDRKLGVPVKVSFQLSNVGDQPLRFAQEPYVEVKEGC